MEHSNQLIKWDDFAKIEIRVGTIIHAEIFPEARKPSYKLKIDFGPYGIKKTSAQLTKLYIPVELIGKQVVAVLNFLSKQSCHFHSECLILGAMNHDEVTLLTTDMPTENGLLIG